MAKTSFESYRPERRISAKAEHILKKTLSKKQKVTLDRLKTLPDSQIDYSDIPSLTDEQLGQMVRRKLYRPMKRAVSVRLDIDVLEWLKSQGKGYLTQINTILRDAMLSQNRR